MENSAFGSRVRLRHLRCFVTVAQEGNMGRAAQRLHLTQPAMSKTLAELEELAGVRLFERGRGRQPDAGRTRLPGPCAPGAGGAGRGWPGAD